MIGTIHLRKDKQMSTINVDLVYKVGVQSGVPVPMGPNDVIAAKFTTPADLGTGGGANGYVSVVENNSSPQTRDLCISTTAGDFTPNALGNHGTPTNFQEGMAPAIYFGQAAPPGKKPGQNFVLAPSTVYYANVKNLSAGDPNCAILITLQAR